MKKKKKNLMICSVTPTRIDKIEKVSILSVGEDVYQYNSHILLSTE